MEYKASFFYGLYVYKFCDTFSSERKFCPSRIYKEGWKGWEYNRIERDEILKEKIGNGEGAEGCICL